MIALCDLGYEYSVQYGSIMSFNPCIIDTYRCKQLYVKLLSAPQCNFMRLKYRDLRKCIENECRVCKVVRFLCVTRGYRESLRGENIFSVFSIGGVCMPRVLYVLLCVTRLSQRKDLMRASELCWISIAYVHEKNVSSIV